MIRSEDQILSILDEYFPREHPFVRLGRGDDCAELAPVGGLAISTDLFIEDVHFRRSYFLPEDIGHKALAVNLSDLAAAGALPLGFSLGLELPRELPEADLRGIFSGMSALAARYNAPLTGGDISRGQKLAFCITVLGYAALPGAPFLRRDPRPGDRLFVIGPGTGCKLGLARLGLEELEKNGRKALKSFPEAAAALLRPEPLLAAGAALAGHALKNSAHVALMDLSDGLARDLPRFVGSYGADLDFGPEDLHAEHGANALSFAVSGGDDYLLLGAVAADASVVAPDLPPGFNFLEIGRVTAKPGLLHRGRPLAELGVSAFDHFGTVQEYK